MTGQIAGLVLAGGRSQRFGSEKAVAQLAGLSLLRRAVDTLRPLAANIAVSAVAGSPTEREARTMGLPVVHDAARPEAGPLLGVLAGLAWAQALGARAMLTLPCDVVCAPRDALDGLLRASGAAYIATRRGAESLCALWPLAASPILEKLLASGHPPVRDALQALHAVEIFVSGDDVFLNLNTPDDLARAEALLIKR
jgi:molybdopterin-guanine dinucleotide biosynthesis protein A